VRDLYDEDVKTKRRSQVREKGVEAEAAGRARLAEVCEQFLSADGDKKNEAGKELIQAVFGKRPLKYG
jgi:hypothetical protein